MSIRKYILIPSMLAIASVNATESNDSSLLHEGVILVASDPSLAAVKGKVIGAAEGYAEDKTKSFLSPYFNSIDVSVHSSENYTPEYEIIGLKAYDNGGLQNSFLFSQLGVNRYDDRTTVNIGLGYRHLTEDKKWLLGANVFYDHEFSFNHQRAGAGLELKSSVFKVNYNLYDGISDFKTDENGNKAKALDGYDYTVDLALPYLPGVAISYEKFEWTGVEGATNLEGEKVSLKGNLSPSFHVSAGTTSYEEAGKDSENWVKLTYQMSFSEDKKGPSLFSTSNEMYKLSSVEHEKYKPVQRENRIIKQKQFATTVSGN